MAYSVLARFLEFVIDSRMKRKAMFYTDLIVQQHVYNCWSHQIEANCLVEQVVNLIRIKFFAGKLSGFNGRDELLNSLNYELKGEGAVHLIWWSIPICPFEYLHEFGKTCHNSIL